MIIKLDTLEKTKAFLILALKTPWYIKILLKQDDFCINGRQSLGLLSLNPKETMLLELKDTSLDNENADEIEVMKGFYEVFCE